MGTRLYELDVTIPAGTAKSAAVVTPWPLENNILDTITVVIPSGHCGFTGVRVLQASQQIVPWGNSSYIVANDEKIPIDINIEIGASAITVQAYNTDVYAHTFYLRAAVRDIPLPAPSGASVTSGIGVGIADSSVGTIGGTIGGEAGLGGGIDLSGGTIPPLPDSGTLPPLPALPPPPLAPTLPEPPDLGPAPGPAPNHHDQQVMLIQH